MTKREFMTAIANGQMNEEIQAEAASYIEKMDAANEARKNKMTEKQLENEKLKGEIVSILSAEAQTATTIGEKMEISTQKASALLRQLAAEGKTIVEEISIKGKGKQKGYKIL